MMSDDVRKMAEEILACVYSPVSPFVVDRLEARLRAALDQAREEGRRAEGVSLCHFNEVATDLDSAEGERDFLARRVEELEDDLEGARGDRDIAREDRDALLALGRAAVQRDWDALEDATLALDLSVLKKLKEDAP